jgi:hypothetical protein
MVKETGAVARDGAGIPGTYHKEGSVPPGLPERAKIAPRLPTLVGTPHHGRGVGWRRRQGPGRRRSTRQGCALGPGSYRRHDEDDMAADLATIVWCRRILVRYAVADMATEVLSSTPAGFGLLPAPRGPPGCPYRMPSGRLQVFPEVAAKEICPSSNADE